MEVDGRWEEAADGTRGTDGAEKRVAREVAFADDTGIGDDGDGGSGGGMGGGRRQGAHRRFGRHRRLDTVARVLRGVADEPREGGRARVVSTEGGGGVEAVGWERGRVERGRSDLMRWRWSGWAAGDAEEAVGSGAEGFAGSMGSKVDGRWCRLGRWIRKWESAEVDWVLGGSLGEKQERGRNRGRRRRRRRRRRGSRRGGSLVSLFKSFTVFFLNTTAIYIFRLPTTLC